MLNYPERRIPLHGYVGLALSDPSIDLIRIRRTYISMKLYYLKMMKLVIPSCVQIGTLIAFQSHHTMIKMKTFERMCLSEPFVYSSLRKALTDLAP